MLDFPSDWPGCKIVNLEKNYRSASPIIAAANTLIAKNKARLGKRLIAQKNGPAPRAVVLSDCNAEASWVARQIAIAMKEGTPAHEIGVLARTGGALRQMEEALVGSNVPYILVGATNFFGHEEVKDGIAYARLIDRPDDDLAFRRIAAKPARGIGKDALYRIEQRALRERVPILEAAAWFAEQKGTKKPAVDGIGMLLQALDNARTAISNAAGLGNAIRGLLKETGYTEYAGKQAKRADERLENLDSLCTAADGHPNLAAFLESAALLEETAGRVQQSAVSLMTIHASKGLEFDRIFLIGCRDDVMPSKRALTEGAERAGEGKTGSEAEAATAAGETAALEEERRLAYVGFTRARTHLTVTAPMYIRDPWPGSPASAMTRFVTEAGLRTTVLSR